MTDPIYSHPAYWASLDRCLHQHHTLIASDLRLQAAHAALQLQLATYRVLHPDAAITHSSSDRSSLRGSLEFLLREVSENILTPAFRNDPEKPPVAAALPPQAGLADRTLLELAEDTVRFLRDHPSLWTQFGLAALQVRALADLHNAYAVETGELVPSGSREERSTLAVAEIARLIRQELDPLVRAHETGASHFVAAYQRARQSGSPGASSDSKPASRPRGRFPFRFGRKAELTLPN